MLYLRVSVVLVVLVLLFSSSIHAQNTPEPIPGVHMTNGSIPWALDVYNGKQQLVPIHHTGVELNNHKGANVAGSLAGSVFYKPKMTTEIDGAHARIALHTDKPVFYVHVMDDPGGDSSDPIGMRWAIVRASINKDHRILAQISFTQLTGNSKRNDSQVEATIEKLSDGWFKITPKDLMSPGEYALLPVPKAANAFSTAVFDFTIDPKAPNSSEALSSPSS